MRRIAIIADTHLRDQALPEDVTAALRGADLILHAGDLCSLTVLDRLSLIAPVTAVHGNNDDDVTRTLLPREVVICVYGRTILLIHGDEGRTAVQTARRAAARLRPGDIVVFGHSHQPYKERQDGVLLFNPGSPTAPRFSRTRSYGMLTFERGAVDPGDVAIVVELHQVGE